MSTEFPISPESLSAQENLPVGQRRGPRAERRALRRLMRNPLSIVGCALVVVFLIVLVAAPAIAPHGYSGLKLADALKGPSSTHLLGTDQFGRDMLSRIIYGTRISMLVGIVSTAISAVVGILIGLVAGFFGGWVDELLMRLMDIMLCFPQIVLAIALAASAGPSLRNVVLVVGVLGIPQFARLIRGSVLVCREMDYVTAARTAGESEIAIMGRHILPNTWGPSLVMISLTVPTAMLTETALSFLGLGIDPTGIPSWGSLLADGRNFMIQAPWIATFPGVAITFAVLAFNLLGDGLRDVMDIRN
jgi:peptide/nickel transport system permease protein